MLITLPATINTKRIPELVDQVSPLVAGDKVLIWIAADNKTRQVSVQYLKDFLDPAVNSGTYIPVYIGGRFLYVVPADKDGDDRFSIPALAGKNFSVVLDMLPLIPGQDYLALNTGGIVLINGSKLIQGQKYSIEVFELTDGSTPNSGSNGSGKYINGKRVINTNWNVIATDSGIVHQLRKAGNSAGDYLSIVMPDVALVPVDSYFIFESFVGDNNPHKFTFTGGQYCYANNKSYDTLYICRGEKFVFYRDVDGWYLIDGYQHLLGIGRPQFAWVEENNEVVYDGREYLRRDVPRLVQLAESAGSSWVTDEVWNTVTATPTGSRAVPKPYRGCFSKGSDTVGNTKIRVPDLRDVALAGLSNFFGTADSQRVANFPGVFQLNELIQHDHDIDAEFNGSDGSQNARTIKPNSAGEAAPTASGTKTKTYGGVKTRMDNVGFLIVAKC